jgi:H+-transporting ATPase
MSMTEPRGLTTAEAEQRLREYGPNQVAAEKPHRLLLFLGKFWAPVPWMLEVTILLEVVLRRPMEALIISVLLIFNALLSFFEEDRAQNALALLRKRLAVTGRVLRDARWQSIQAEALVPGDFVHLRMGDLVPADVQITEGDLLLDQSTLTGESQPVEMGQGKMAYAGSMVKRGEASGDVTATGSKTYFGKTAELVRSAKTVSHLQSMIFAVVKYLLFMDAILAVVLLGYAVSARLPLADTLPFLLILLVASVPAALPATFTLATGIGALELARQGVLVTRLSAIEEAAAMDVLCTDKTGTITENQLVLTAVHLYPPFSEEELLHYAACASDEATQDPIDLAVFSYMKAKGFQAIHDQRTRYVPFEPATKLSEATIAENGQQLDALKGAPQAVAERVSGWADIRGDADQMSGDGSRVLAVAAGKKDALRLVGLLGFQDPPRSDSKDLVEKLKGLGVRVVMVTGDGLSTARAVAAQVGIDGRACSAADLHDEAKASIEECGVFAGVFPEDKFHLVRRLQLAGHVVGMTGDGVNDAPALKEAEVGIAVSSATDVAKASASIVLTTPGLTNALSAVETSRRIYQRMLTYTLNKIIKTVEIAFFLSLGVIVTHTFIITPLLIVFLLFTNDFVTMSIATDTVSFSPMPDRWNIRTLMKVGAMLGSLVLFLSFGLFFYGRNVLGLPLPQLQTLVFLMLVFTGQGMVYLIRERRHFWHSVPSRWMLLSSFVDVTLVCVFAIKGILMAPLPATVVGFTILTCGLYLVGLDFVKVPIFQRWMAAA